MTPQARPRSSAGDTTPRRGGRLTREAAKRLDHAVRECALELFLEHGYQGTSMDAIASAAGTTKASLYARFSSKDAVFRAVLAWATQRTDWPVQDPPVPNVDDLEGALTAVARAALRRALDPSMIKLSQVAIAHASQFPEIARQAAGVGVSPRRQLVVDLLRRHAATGAIVADDPELLAEHFLSMVAGAPGRLASFGVIRDAAEQERHTQTAVQLFLRGLRPA